QEVVKIAWIALRHDIRYRSEAFLGDQLEAKVLLRGFRGSRSQFEIQFSRGSVSVAEVDTTLCCIDRETRQLHRITHELARHFAIVA
ncbi:MAG TPA: thioesterase, partial [Erythrobacter sp.]|nr:thioesterase [Erythrobacter sp.]